jgi:hypothetical protein
MRLPESRHSLQNELQMQTRWSLPKPHCLDNLIEDAVRLEGAINSWALQYGRR